MKWTSIDLSRIRRWTRDVGLLVKSFTALALLTMVFFILLGMGGYAQTKLQPTPVSSMKGLAAAMSSDFFLDMMGLEVPYLQQEDRRSALSQNHIFGFVFRLLTDINPEDPKTLFAREVPGLSGESSVLLRKGSVTDFSSGPQDYRPSADNISDNVTAPTPPAAAPEPTPAPQPTEAPAAPKPQVSGKKVVMIYHSHNRESWVPELGIKDPDKAYDEKKNITLVGKRLARKLEDLGIGAVDNEKDYTTAEKNYTFAYSYKYSLKTVREAFAAHPDIKFVFDIHRDSLSREKTTARINGKDYAQIYFIIGQKNPNWEKNEQFAAKIHERLEQTMPGLSRGIWGKTPHDGNAEYNQSLSPNSVLLEIGGPFNTLEETYRTTDLLAGVIADLYWDAEKVSAPAAPSQNSGADR